jgi:hypothetical protein
MIKLGLLLTIYLCLSFGLFGITSFTVTAWILYQFLLLPFYGILWLGCWIFIWLNWTKTAKLKWGIWSLVLTLQIVTMLASPGNCYGVKKGDRCYSNLQVLIGNLAREGPNTAPHWLLLEDAFPGFLAAYGVALLTAVLKTKVGARSILQSHNS